MKYRTKKIISIILILVMWVSLLPVSTFSEDEDTAGLISDQSEQPEEEILAVEEDDNVIEEEHPPVAEPVPEAIEAGETSGTCGTGLTWTYDEGTLTISGSGKMDDYTSATGGPWYSWRYYISTVAIASGVTSIGNFAFFDCGSITDISIPDSVTEIGGNAFEFCSALQSVSIGTGLSTIGQYPFKDCGNLSSIQIASGNTTFKSEGNCVINISSGELVIGCKASVIPSGVTSIAPNSFFGVTGLISAVIPEGVTEIGYSAFQSCSGLVSVTIPVSMTLVDDYAFFGCENIEDVYYNGTQSGWNTSISFKSYNDDLLGGSIHCDVDRGTCTDGLAWVIDQNYCLTISGTGGMKEYDEVEIGETDTYTTDAPWGAYNKSVNSIVIGQGITGIGNYAFCHFDNITSASFTSDVISIGEAAFYGCTKLSELSSLASVVTIGESAFGNCEKLKEISLCPTLTSIPAYAFNSCDSLTSVCIPDSVTSIGQDAFQGCGSLSVVTLGSGISSICQDAFRNCTALSAVIYTGADWSSVTVATGNDLLTGKLQTKLASGECGENVSWILSNDYVLTIYGTGAMYDYESLEDSVESNTSAPWGADYHGLIKTVVIASGVTGIGECAFMNCGSISEVIIGSDVEIIGNGAFFYCFGLKRLSVPGNVKTIEESAFYGCYNLADLSFSAGLLSINNYAFAYCYSLTSVTIPDSVVNMAEGAFYTCEGLKNVKLGTGLTGIAKDAFTCCYDLSTVEFGSNIKSIGYNAFYGCGIEAVYFNGNEADWDAITIGENNYNLTRAARYYVKGSGVCSDGLQWTVYRSSGGSDTLVLSGSGDMSYYGTADYSGHSASGAPWGEYYGSVKEIIIGSGLSSLNLYAFYGFTELESISFAEGIVHINSYAFAECPKLASLDLPDSLKTIDQHAFENCTGLKTVDFGKGTDHICAYAFNGCTGLSHASYKGTSAEWSLVQIDENNSPLTDLTVNCLLGSGSCGENLSWLLSDYGVLSISGCGYMDDYTNGTAPWYSLRGSIKSLELSKGVESIGSYAFADCTALQDATIYTLDLGDYAFYNCSSLNVIISDYFEIAFADKSDFENGNLSVYNADHYRIILSRLLGSNIRWKYCDNPENVTLFITGTGDMKDWNSYNNDDSPWYSYRSYIKSVIIGTGITGIGNCSFYNLNNLESVSIPDTVTSIGTDAFNYCTSLENVSMGNGVKTIGENAFYHCEAIEDLTLGSSVETIDNNAFVFCKSIKKLIIPDSVKTIGAYAFYHCEAIEDLTLGSSVETIDNYAFEYCKGIKKVIIPDSVKTIDSCAFHYCEGLETLVIGNGVETIKNTAFAYCKSLKNLTFGSSVKRIEQYAFEYCTSLESVVLPGSLEGLENNVFYKCSSLTEVVIGYGIGRIREFSFSWCTALKTVVIPDSVTEICEEAFSVCTSLTDVYLPSGLLKIGEAAFCDCSALKNIDLPASLKEIGASAFAGCSSLSSIEIPALVDRINDYAFSETALKHINIPDSVTYIGDHAFNGCTELKEVQLPDNIVSIMSSTFENCTSLESIHLPSKLLYIYRDAFSGCSALREIYIDSLGFVYQDAFKDCTALSSVYYSDTKSQWDTLKEYYIYEGNECLLNAALYCFIADGSCSSTISWGIDWEGTLILDGYNYMFDYLEGQVPWYAFRDQIKKVKLNGDILYIGDNAFYGIDGIQEVEFIGTTYQWENLKAFSGVGNDSFFNACRRPAEALVKIDREYIAVKQYDKIQLNALIEPDYWKGTQLWSSDNPSVAGVNVNSGYVQAYNPGTANISVSVEIDGMYYTSTCRVDVMGVEIFDAVACDPILSSSKVTSVLFSRDYAVLEVDLNLEQNLAPEFILSDGTDYSEIEQNGISINCAYFEVEEVADMFSIRVADDRTLQIIPSQTAMDRCIADARSVAAKYVSPIRILLQNSKGELQSVYTEAVTVSVNKKLPSIKAKTVMINSFYSIGTAVPITFTGAEVTGAKLNGLAPVWVSLGENLTAVLTSDVASVSGKMNLLVTAEGWNYQFPVTVTVKAKSTVPTLKLKATGYIDKAVPNSAAVIISTIKNAVGITPFTWTITDKAGADKGAYFLVSEKDGKFTIKENDPSLAAGSYNLVVSLDFNADGISDAAKTVRFNVKASDPAKIKKSVTMKAKGYIDLVRSDSSVAFSLSFKNYAEYVADTGDLKFQKQIGTLWLDVAPGDLPFDIIKSEEGFILKVKSGAMLTTTDKYRVMFHDGISGLETKQVNINIKLGKGKVKADKPEITLFKYDKYCASTVELITDGTYDGIRTVEINGKDASLLGIKSVGTSGSKWSIGYPGGKVTLTKSKTITLNVWFDGNYTSKPSATVKVKINVI